MIKDHCDQWLWIAADLSHHHPTPNRVMSASYHPRSSSHSTHICAQTCSSQRRLMYCILSLGEAENSHVASCMDRNETFMREVVTEWWYGTSKKETRRIIWGRLLGVSLSLFGGRLATKCGCGYSYAFREMPNTQRHLVVKLAVFIEEKSNTLRISFDVVRLLLISRSLALGRMSRQFFRGYFNWDRDAGLLRLWSHIFQAGYKFPPFSGCC